MSPSLRSLDLSYNHLADISDSSLEKLSNLQILRLHHNRVTNIQKSAVSGLTSIQIIDLSSNQVLPPRPAHQFWLGINVLPSLLQLESLQFGQFAGLSSLRMVDFSDNRLRSLPRDAFQVD